MGETSGLDGKSTTVREAVQRERCLGALALVEPHRLVGDQEDPMPEERQVRKTWMNQCDGGGRPALPFLTVG